jgi:hypothetical protein
MVSNAHIFVATYINFTNVYNHLHSALWIKNVQREFKVEQIKIALKLGRIYQTKYRIYNRVSFAYIRNETSNIAIYLDATILK